MRLQNMTKRKKKSHIEQVVQWNMIDKRIRLKK